MSLTCKAAFLIFTPHKESAYQSIPYRQAIAYRRGTGSRPGETRVKVVSFEGVLRQPMREVTVGGPGFLWPVGLHTFVDPRLGGGRLGSVGFQNALNPAAPAVKAVVVMG